jgi:hypothetical protein
MEKNGGSDASVFVLMPKKIMGWQFGFATYWARFARHIVLTTEA